MSTSLRVAADACRDQPMSIDFCYPLNRKTPS